jgi:hypothetical protein
MPPRLLTLAIIVAWLGMSSWLFYQDVWPRLRSGEPPPFRIEFSDEVQTPRPPARWTVSKNGKQAYIAKTEMKYDAALDQFEMTSELSPKPGLPGNRPLTEQLAMTSIYVISREGELRKFTVKMKLPILFGTEAEMNCEVRDGKLYSRVSAPLLGPATDLEPVPFVAKGSALNPMQPWDRLPNLRPGQRWRLPLYNPVVIALSGNEALTKLSPGLKDSGISFLDAEVSQDAQSLAYGDREEACRVIEYKSITGDDTHGRTWVRISDGLVLKQEMTLRDDDWEMRRDP